MNALVTLITPVYNAMPYFREYLESVLQQTWRPLEFICIDDGSTDASFACLEEYMPAFAEKGILLKYKRISHAGQAQAVNEALQLAEGNFITWCDADDVMMPENIEKKAVFLIQHPQLGMVRNDGSFTINGSLPRRNTREEDRKQQNIFDALFHDRTYCYAGCYMLRSSLLFACYPDRRIPVSVEGQNLQLLLPPASRTECGYLPDELHIYRKRPDGHSGKKRSFNEVIQRKQNFTALKCELLEYCQCDRDYYRQEALEIEKAQRRHIYMSMAQKAREEMKHENRNSDFS